MNKCKQKPTCSGKYKILECFKSILKWFFQGYHWEKEKNPKTGEVFIHHEYGICILKEFPDPTQKVERSNKFEEHKLAILDYKNNETETNLNLSIAFKESFEKKLSGSISQNDTDFKWNSELGSSCLDSQWGTLNKRSSEVTASLSSGLPEA